MVGINNKEEEEMKKRWLWIGVIGMMTSTVHAQDYSLQGKERFSTRREFDGATLRAVQEKIMQEAGLTAEEQKQLHVLGEQDRVHHQRLQKLLWDAMEAMKQAEQNVAATEQELDAAIDRVQEIQREILKNRVMRLRRVRQVLGEEKARELMQATRRRMEGRREKKEEGGMDKRPLMEAESDGM